MAHGNGLPPEESNFEAIETHIQQMLGKNMGDWIDIAKLLKKVDEDELWRSGNYRSFTVWMRSTAKKTGISESSIWRIFRAIHTLEQMNGELHLTTSPDIADALKERGWITMSGLNAIAAIEDLKLDSDYTNQLRQEFADGTMSWSNLAEIRNEVDRCQRAEVKNVAPLLALRKVSFSEILEKKKERALLITDIAKDEPIDALAILGSPEHLEFIAIVIDRKLTASSAHSGIDWVLHFRTTKEHLFDDKQGVVDLDIKTGSYHVVYKPQKRKTDPHVKAKICEKLLLRLMFTKKSDHVPLSLEV